MAFVPLAVLATQLVYTYGGVQSSRFTVINCTGNALCSTSSGALTPNENLELKNVSMVLCAAHCLLAASCQAYLWNRESRTCVTTTTLGLSVRNLRGHYIIVQRWRGLISPTYVPPTCHDRLVAPLPTSALSATSSIDSSLVPECAKLYGAPSSCSGYAGSWSPASLSDSEYLLMDLMAPKTITGYEIMGRINDQGHSYGQWVASFLISYSSDGISYESYRIQGVDTIFNGNVDVSNRVNTSLPYPLAATRYLRIQPYNFNNYKSFRIEIYGCDRL